MRMLFIGVVLMSSQVLAAEPSNAELAARIAGLEARMAQLEARGAAGKAPSTSTSAKALDMENWRECKAGMTREEVIELLGEPTTRQHVSAVNQYSESETLMYGNVMGDPGGTVVLMSGRVIQCIAMNFAAD
ncbi:hypothetical protein [Luteimonas sp. MC1750]|uniref:hypothetical protein n=1 Tax=Luteimonas sp. MC1750 TaxID=2799326 RepID=UPI0018F0D4FC|nr:hypothetical protein [Luteimonas sp. MC1750]MBJ6984045.1 hypothetical protein [Luteimonas sp. MC1750]QQO06857.1 hypothetical protein JGR68_05365 [Luteimonas sp. MC1750]